MLSDIDGCPDVLLRKRKRTVITKWCCGKRYFQLKTRHNFFSWMLNGVLSLRCLQTTPGFIVDGNVVRNVFSGGPADRAGLRKGDVIQAINNLPTASDSSLLVKYLAAVPEGSTVFLTWVNKDEEVVRATVELVDSNRFSDVMQAYLKLLQLEDASTALVQSVDSVLRDEGSDALKSEMQMQEIVGTLGMSHTRLKDLTSNLEGDVAAILSRQRAAEEEVKHKHDFLRPCSA